MTGATICSGILAPEAAMPWVDWQWCAEIDPFACALIKHHRPRLPNLGDVTAPDFIERCSSVDLLVAGTPCQAFSVAGLRKSLDDSRGNITLRLVEIVHAIRPRILLWENVPGVLSTPDNAFGCFLAGLIGAPEAVSSPAGWSSAGVVSGPAGTAAWRVLDAQYFGLAQRRKRVFLVFCFGGGPDPAEILFEWESLRRDSPPSRQTGQRVAPSVTSRLADGGYGHDFDTGGGLVESVTAPLTGNPHADRESRESLLVCAFGGNNTSGKIDVATACRAHHSAHLDFESETMIVGPPCYGIDEEMNATEDGFGVLKEHGSGGFQGSVACFKGGQGASAGGLGYSESLSPTLGSADSGSNRTPAVMQSMSVRRLTPTECERLQGFPDGYTAIPYRGKPAADGPRYKGLGNSMAVPVVAWIGERIRKFYEADLVGN